MTLPVVALRSISVSLTIRMTTVWPAWSWA